MLLTLYILLALFLLGLVAAVAGWWRNRRLPAGEPVLNPVDMECCGQHEVCEKESLLAALSKQIEYYNDEELDRFRGRPSDTFSVDETEEFREILYTMRSDEVAGWVRSLQLRGVEIPDGVKDEVLMIVGERRGL
ncbi:MAG: phospholipase [Bacteroidaceae bacterium]|nr:phospholipase [Bacteroidaceae bacterium]